jgi:hypothetical protein
LLILDEDPRLRLSALDSIESLILNGTVVDRDRLLDLKTTQ